jgi:hypothetical protein
LCLYTALGARNRVHLARWALASRGANATTLRAAGRAAVRAAGWLVHQPFLLVEFLLTRGEHKILAALTTFESFVSEAQLGASFESIGYPVPWSLVAWLTRVSPSSVGLPCLCHALNETESDTGQSIHYSVPFFKGFYQQFSKPDDSETA